MIAVSPIPNLELLTSTLLGPVPPEFKPLLGFTSAKRYLQLFGREDVTLTFACVKLVELHPGRAGRDFTSAQFADSVRRVIQLWDAQRYTATPTT